jgi:hypothetical protein
MITQDDWIVELSQPHNTKTQSFLQLLFPRCLDHIRRENAAIRDQLNYQHQVHMVSEIEPMQRLVIMAKIQAKRIANRKLQGEIRRIVYDRAMSQSRFHSSPYIPPGYCKTTSDK